MSVVTDPAVPHVELPGGTGTIARPTSLRRRRVGGGLHVHVGRHLEIPTPSAGDPYRPALERRRTATALIEGLATLGVAQRVSAPGIGGLAVVPGSTVHVHLHEPGDLGIALILAQPPTTRIVVHLRSSSRAPLRSGAKANLRTRLVGSPMERLLMGRSALVVTCSERLAELARAAGARRTLVVPTAPTPAAIGLPASPPRPLPERAGRRIVSVGALVARRRSASLVEILPHLPDDVHLILIGTGPDRLTIDRAARRLGVADRVGVVPTASHRTVAAHLAHADVVASAALAGDDLPELLAAMAAGRPLVATNVEGVRTHVTAGIDGSLVDPADSPALTRAVRRLLSDPQLASALGASARRRTRGHDWAAVANPVLDALGA